MVTKQHFKILFSIYLNINSSKRKKINCCFSLKYENSHFFIKRTYLFFYSRQGFIEAVTINLFFRLHFDEWLNCQFSIIMHVKSYGYLTPNCSIRYCCACPATTVKLTGSVRSSVIVICTCVSRKISIKIRP